MKDDGDDDGLNMNVVDEDYDEKMMG